MRCNAEDYNKVWRVLTNDDVYKNIIDDSVSANFKFQITGLLLYNPSVYVVMPNDDCVFVGRPLNPIFYDVHTSVHPNGRGRGAVEAAREAIAWMFNNSRCHKMIGFTPKINQTALRFARLVGFKMEGVSERSFLKDGVLHDQVISGLTKEDWLWQSEQQ